MVGGDIAVGGVIVVVVVGGGGASGGGGGVVVGGVIVGGVRNVGGGIVGIVGGGGVVVGYSVVSSGAIAVVDSGVVSGDHGVLRVDIGIRAGIEIGGASGCQRVLYIRTWAMHSECECLRTTYGDLCRRRGHTAISRRYACHGYCGSRDDLW